jgi:hypothetical protein
LTRRHECLLLCAFEQTCFLVMSTANQLAIAMLAVFVVAVIGCHKQKSADAELANAVKVLERAEPGPQFAPGAPAASVANPAAAPAQASPEAVTSQPVAQQMSQALTAYKAGDYSDAIARLQWLRTKATRTPEQTMAIQDAMAAVMTELYARAEKGDARAQQALKQHQEMRNKR